MSTKSFKQFFTERRYGEGGLEYEDEVRKAIAQASPELSNFDVLPDMAGGFASNVVDLYAVIDGKQYGFEIKQNANAQMGGSSPKANSHLRLLEQRRSILTHNY